VAAVAVAAAEAAVAAVAADEGPVIMSQSL